MPCSIKSLLFKKKDNKICLYFLIMRHPNLYWNVMHFSILLFIYFRWIKTEDNLLDHKDSWILEGHSLCAELLAKHLCAPKLPFFFLDKDSICHWAIYSLQVRISMISNHSASLLSPWHHLCNASTVDDT